MRAKTQAQYDRQRERRRQRKAEMNDISQMLSWKTCDWCGIKWNPAKVPVWLGKKTCPSCADFPRRILHRMLELKIVKLRKHSKPPPKFRPVNWGHLGVFDPTRPWLKWVDCAFCSIPMCTNNNAQHQVRLRTWRGHPICGKCTRTIKIMLPKLKKMKYLRVRDPK